jgi:hypothetical protein
MRDVVMPAVDPIERQMRLVRRRRNLLELQRGAFFLIATAATSAAALVLLALVASERLFAAASWSLGGAVAATAVLLGGEVRRRWMSPDGVAAWVDAHAGLRGRLATLVAVRARDPRVEHAFLPLLVADNVARLPTWRADRLVRRPVPRAALAAALAATTALALAVLLAPRLRPPFPEIVYSDEPVDGVESDDQADSTPSRVVVAPARGDATRRHERETGPAVGGDTTGASGGGDDSRLAQLSSALQDRIRRDLWGREWERMRDAMARAERAMVARRSESGRSRGGADANEERGAEDDQGWETAGLPSTRAGARRPARKPGGDPAANGHAADANDADAAARGMGDEESLTAPRAGSGEPAPGAGNETDPNLFGPATDVDPRGGDTFELAINAPVRAGRGGPRRPSGEAPAADRDTQPQLGRSTRGEQTIRRMPVPAAYEPIVREVFAHRDAAADTGP